MIVPPHVGTIGQLSSQPTVEFQRVIEESPSPLLLLDGGAPHLTEVQYTEYGEPPVSAKGSSSRTA